MILCVDPDPAALESTRQAFHTAGLDTCGAETAADAREQLVSNERPDCLVTEYELPDANGLDLVRELRDTAPDAPCVLFTDVPVGEIDSEATGTLVVEYVPKETPTAREELVELVEHSLGFKSQTAYPLPENEDARLAALRQYATDSQALDDAFERLMDVAAALFEVDTATIGLVEEHEEQFVSCRGSSYDSMAREDTICTYTILDEAVTVVEDTQKDPRFRENGSLVEADIRSYAGAPMLTATGEAIGAFCLHHDEPRAFTEQERTLLATLAEEAMDQLELRHRLQQVQGEPDDS